MRGPCGGRSPVPVDVGCAEGKAVVQEGGVDHGSVLRPLQQVSEVAEMPVAASDSIPGAVLIKHKHLPGTEPALCGE